MLQAIRIFITRFKRVDSDVALLHASHDAAPIPSGIMDAVEDSRSRCCRVMRSQVDLYRQIYLLLPHSI